MYTGVTMLMMIWTATFHITSYSLGGIVKFGYTVDYGPSGGDSTSTPVFAAGASRQIVFFTWSEALPADHILPEPGEVIVSSLNVDLAAAWTERPC
ncbi:MAG: hypothetical protein IRZ31_16325 [Thermogemmatispora sp.]|nr:hypothetical protein [Thermogemmatispora sp.]